MKKLILYLFTLCLGITTMSAQTVTGVITGADDGQPLPGVNIKIKGTDRGTITDLDGKYSVEVPGADAVLIFSYVGYSTQEITVGSQTAIDVVLAQGEDIDEVIIVGYGVKKKSLVTGAISSVSAEDLENLSTSRADQAIQGKTSGVMVMPNSGSPGAATKIRIRGTNSNGNSNPLFIVDGMKTGDINNIEPGDIESIEVLKDAASAAIYGTEGSNGVVLITTKSGKAGKSVISYDFQYGVQSARTKMKMMNADQYTTWQQEAGQTPNDTYNANTDWLDELFEKAPMQSHRISFSGGNDKTTYLASGSYRTQDGIVGGSKANYSRYTARLNVNSKLKNWLEVGAKISYMHQEKDNVVEDDEYSGVVNSALNMDPLTPVLYDGVPTNIQTLLDGGSYPVQDGDGNYYALAENATGEIRNPIAYLETINDESIQDKIMGTGYVNIKPIEGLVITSRAGFDLANQRQGAYDDLSYFNVQTQNNALNVRDNINVWHTWLWENFANYTKTFGDLNMTVLAGVSAQKYQGRWYYLYSGPMPGAGWDFAYHSSVLSQEFDDVQSTGDENTMSSQFGRLSLDYQGKYLFEASIRRDGASVFPKDNKYGVFPAVSLGWVVSEESFMSGLSFMDYLKVRGSWGQNGSKANLQGNEDINQWTFGGIRYPNSSDIYISGARSLKLTNPDLVWERTEMIDFGVDFRFLNSKLSLTLDYYQKTTKDLIAAGTPPPSVGGNPADVNAGDVTNKGFEIDLGYREMEGEFKYGVSVNFSTNKNEVTDLKVDADVIGANVRGYNLTWFSEGHPIWYFKGYKTNGIDATTGDPIIVDTNNSGDITPDDQVEIGSPHPDFVYGANLFAEYKGFDFNISIQGSKGNDVWMGWFRQDRPMSNKPEFFYTDRWTPTNTNASFPSARNADDYTYRSDLMVQDGSYLRIKQIQLGYTLPKDLISNIGLSSVRAYISLDNYFTFTKYKGLDPEAGSNDNNSLGVDRGVYPSAGAFLFGLSVKF